MQYRSHPDLVDWYNHRYCKGHLRSQASLQNNSSVTKTIRHFFDQLHRARMSRSNRIVIDVSDADAPCVKHHSTGSYCNPSEAQMVVALVEGLLAYLVSARPKSQHKTDRLITPSSLCVVMPWVIQ